jgi:predicted AlkP superfamily pyrophosphatase or phosphodiesterase
MRWLPAKITSRRIFRRYLSKFVKRSLNFRGYFDLYNVPFHQISWYDFTEKKSPLQPNGMNRGGNIFDHLGERKIPYHVSDPAWDEKTNLRDLVSAIEAESIDFAFLYWPGLDALLHGVGNNSPKIKPKLREYEAWIKELVDHAKAHYSDVRLWVFSDHGMANCDELLDLRKQIDALGLTVGKDYAVVYDSTMARFWFMNDAAREKITAHLATVPQGRVLPDSELEDMGTLFPDRYFGELIFLVKEGGLIVPSHMGERPITAMHGYHPADKHSYAALCASDPDVPEEVTAIPDMYRLMTRAAEMAHAANMKRLDAVGA